MTEEEKEKLEVIKDKYYKYHLTYEDDTFLLTLIGKQQEEIEELKETVEFVNSHYISKDKIKEKIKEYSNDKYEFLVARENIITILNELLEE